MSSSAESSPSGSPHSSMEVSYDRAPYPHDPRHDPAGLLSPHSQVIHRGGGGIGQVLSPGTGSVDQVDLFHLIQERKRAWSSCNLAASAFRFLYLELTRFRGHPHRLGGKEGPGCRRVIGRIRLNSGSESLSSCARNGRRRRWPASLSPRPRRSGTGSGRST